MCLCLDVSAPLPAQTSAPSDGPGAASGKLDIASTEVAQAQNALHAGHPEQALELLKQALAQDPENAAADLLASSAEIALFAPEDAVRYGERAQALAPGSWKVHTTLVTAYAMAGDTAHRDAERALLRQDHANPSLADARAATGFLLDLFRAGRYRVEAVEYFRPLGKYNTYYRFIIRNAAGARVWTIEVNSDSLNQASWAQSYPKQAAEGQRQFQIESPEGPEHVEYRTFSGAPSYDYARSIVVKLLAAQDKPFPGEAAAQ